MVHLARKPYTAELKLMRQKDAPTEPMAVAGLDELRQEIAALRAEMRDMVIKAPPPEASGGGTVPTAEASALKTELRALAFCIEQTKSEIAALRSEDDDVDRLYSVTSELDAVVSATENATHQILSSSERIETLMREARAHLSDGYAGRILEDVQDCTIAIFEACNFQDITGQRISKVVRTLQYIESRINSMVEIWGEDSFTTCSRRLDEPKAADEALLLNGPQLGNGGISQEDIDRLFA